MELVESWYHQGWSCQSFARNAAKQRRQCGHRTRSSRTYNFKASHQKEGPGLEASTITNLTKKTNDDDDDDGTEFMPPKTSLGYSGLVVQFVEGLSTVSQDTPTKPNFCNLDDHLCSTKFCACQTEEGCPMQNLVDGS